MNKDLTVGKPHIVLLKFCLPLFGSIIFQQLYNIADSFIAGRFLGEDALSAVGNSTEITLIFIAFAFGLNIGCSVIVSRFFGAKDYTSMKSAVYSTFFLAGGICAILMLFGLIFGRQLLEMINTPDNLMADSLEYLRIYIYGTPFLFFYNISTGIFSAMGDSKTPFIFLAISSTANIGMDILFVMLMQGVDGVAWATFVCQGVACFFAVFLMFKRLSTIKTDNKEKIFDLSIIKRVLIVAVPSILQQSFVSVGNIIIQGIVNSFGSMVMAGYLTAVKLNTFVITSVSTFGNGVSNYASQNLGAQKYDRISSGFKSGLIMVFVAIIPITICYFIFSPYLIPLFITNPSQTAITTGVNFLRIVCPFYLIICVKFILDGILRGADLMAYFTCSTFVDLIIRVVLAFIFSKTALNETGIWLSWPFGWVIATILSSFFYYFKFYKKNKQKILS